MNADETRCYLKIAAALNGLPIETGLALLLAMLGDIIEQSGHPEIWGGIAKGAQAKRDGTFGPGLFGGLH